jgi:2-furoate---CoA ligase
MRTGYDLVWQAAERTPDQLAVVDDRSPRTLTYRKLIEEVDVIAAGLQRQGLRAGDRVAVALPNSFDHCLALLALQRIGAVLALINFRLPAKQIAELIADGQMRCALVADEPVMIAAIVERLPEFPVITVGGSTCGGRDFSTCRGDPESLAPPPSPDPDDIAFILYTSGTTGNPKGVLIAHRTTEYRITSMSPIVGLRAGSELRVLGALPLFHGIGFYAGLMTTLVYSGTLFLMSTFSPQSALDMIERQRITFIFVVPTVLQSIVSLPTYRPERVASLEYVLHGGAAIAPALLDQLCVEWNARIQHLYGSTEAYIPLCNPSPRGAPNTFNSVFPQRTRVVRIGGGPDDLAQPGETGELIVDAGNNCMFSGYLDDPRADARKLRGGWFFTGDVFTRRHDGAVDFVGRADDAIRSGGESIYPAEIEQIILAHPSVDEVCVVGIPDNYWGEQVVACIVAHRQRVTAAEIDDHCRAAVLAGFKRPRQYVFVEDLPRNASNKVLRRELRDMVVAGDQELLCA